MAKDNNVKVDVNFSSHAVMKRYKNKSNIAMTALKNEIVKDTEKYVPMRDGGLRKSVVSSIGANENQIVYRKVYARFLYYGKVMVGKISRSPWAKKGETKEAINRSLTYSYGGDHWFDKSKERNIKKWISIARKLFK